jgi:hypothetical protein
MKDAMSMLDEPTETPGATSAAEPVGMDSQVSDAISGTAAGAKLTPDELNELVSAVMGVVNGEENTEAQPADDGGDMDEFDNLVSKKPHPLGKGFEA